MALILSNCFAGHNPIWSKLELTEVVVVVAAVAAVEKAICKTRCHIQVFTKVQKLC